MKVRKVLTGLTATVALIATVAAPSMAGATFASATSIFSVFSYSSTATGRVLVTPAGAGKFTSSALPAFNDIGDTLAFTGLQNVGTALVDQNGIFYNQVLTGGTFTLKKGATTLLSGTFTQAVLGAFVVPNIPNKDANVSFIGVNYTGGTYWTAAQTILGFINPGDLSLALLANQPLHIVNVPGGVRFGSFTASGTGTFGAEQIVPEPAAVVPFALGALCLGILAFRGRKSLRTSNAVAA